VAFPFRGPLWIQRALVGGVLELFPMLVGLVAIPAYLWRPGHRMPLVPLGLLPLVLLVGLLCRFVLLGYMRRIAHNVLLGGPDELPPWDRPIDDLIEGLKLTLVGIAVFIPAIGVTLCVALLVMAATSAAGAVFPIVVLGPPLLFVTLVYFPAALLATIESNELGAAFDMRVVARHIGRCAGPYTLAFLIAIAAEILAQLGLLVCCVGVFISRFLAHCITVHAFATAYRAGAPAATLPALPLEPFPPIQPQA
jgi:hypothetical protein